MIPEIELTDALAKACREKAELVDALHALYVRTQYLFCADDRIRGLIDQRFPDMLDNARAVIERFNYGISNVPIGDAPMHQHDVGPDAHLHQYDRIECHGFEQEPPRQHDLNQHSDDLAIDRFARAMKEKMAQKRGEGRNGWDDPKQCSAREIAAMLLDHLAKGDPVDIGNLAMMLFNRKDDPSALYDEVLGRSVDRFTSLKSTSEQCRKIADVLERIAGTR